MGDTVFFRVALAFALILAQMATHRPKERARAGVPQPAAAARQAGAAGAGTARVRPQARQQAP